MIIAHLFSFTMENVFGFGPSRFREYNGSRRGRCASETGKIALSQFSDQMYTWHDPTYLKTGTPRQQAAYHSLQLLGIFETLKAFTPVLVGTVPIDVDIASSDLDIICQAADLDIFQNVILDAYGEMPDFQVKRKSIERIPSVVAHFPFEGFPIEIFGQALPVQAQQAYRHMIIEARLLELFGEQARTSIRKLKQSGLKTEPAFGRYFHLEGDPYLALLKLEILSDDELLRRFSPSPRYSEPT